MKTQSAFQLSRVRTPLLVALGVTYLGFHVMNGERGVYALFKETQRQSMLHSQWAEISAEREKLELKVSHMRISSLDLDLLDEQLRRMLGMVGEEERVILLPVE